MKIVEYKQIPGNPGKDVLIATCDEDYDIVASEYHPNEQMWINGKWAYVSYFDYMVYCLEKLKQEGYVFTPKAEVLFEWYKNKLKKEQEEKERQEKEKQRLLKEKQEKQRLVMEEQEKQNKVKKAIPTLTKNKMCHAFGCLINASECFSCRYYSTTSRMCVK